MGVDRSPQTIAWYRKRLKPLRSLKKSLAQITLDDLNRFYLRLAQQRVQYARHPSRPAIERPLSPMTLRGYVRAWRIFFNWCVDENLLTLSPARKLPMPRAPEQPPKGISRCDMERILEAARLSSPRDYAIVCILADSACRVGGLCHIALDNLRLDEGYALVEEKGGQLRYLLFTERTVVAIRAYLAVRPAVGERALFIGRKFKPLQPGGVHQLLDRLAAAAGVSERHNPHAWRHGWARWALANGAKLDEVAHVLGHRSVQTTFEFYGRWDPGELRAIHARWTWMGGK